MKSRTICREFRRLRYSSLVAGRFIWNFPFSLVALAAETMCLHLWPETLVSGIQVTDPFPETRSRFVDTVSSALERIEANDHLRFRRVKREIKRIFNFPVLTGVEYSRCFRVCRLDLRRFDAINDRESMVDLLAMKLVHESTHGYLCSKTILQDRNYARTERLCLREEMRLCEKAGGGVACRLGCDPRQRCTTLRPSET
jgi:hypothetical protein